MCVAVVTERSVRWTDLLKVRVGFQKQSEIYLKERFRLENKDGFILEVRELCLRKLELEICINSGQLIYLRPYGVETHESVVCSVRRSS